MDDIVRQAMAKWPNVPDVYGWLSLDRRGNWLIKGESIANEALISFIGRNYQHDNEGRWYFQNGPQRVFVALACAPFVYRMASNEHEPLALDTHTGLHVRGIQSARLDEHGTLLIDTEHGPGGLYDLDLDRLAPHFIDAQDATIDDDTLEAMLDDTQNTLALWLRFGDARIPIERIRSAAIEQRFGFVANPVEHVTPVQA